MKMGDWPDDAVIVHDPLTTISNEETLVDIFLEYLKHLF